MTSPRSGGSWSPTDVRLLSSGIRGNVPTALKDCDAGSVREDDSTRNLPSPCRTRRKLSFFETRLSVLSGGVVEPWLDSPPPSSKEEHECQREQESTGDQDVQELKELPRQALLAEREQHAALEASNEELLAVRAELEKENLELKEALLAEREQHAALEAYWQRQGEELLAYVQEADHGLIRREGALAEREAAAEQLKRQLADLQEDLKAEKEELSAKKLLMAEKELSLQDREEALVMQEQAEAKPEGQLQSRRSSAASFVSAESASPHLAVPPSSPPVSPRPPSTQPPEMYLEDVSSEDSDSSELSPTSLPRFPLREPGPCHLLRGCGAGAALIFAFQAVWRVLGHVMLRPLPSQSAASRPLLQTLGSAAASFQALNLSAAHDEMALQRLFANRTALDADMLQEAARRSPDEAVQLLLERDAQPLGGPELAQLGMTGEVATEPDDAPNAHLWRHATGAALGLAAAVNVL
mmetsp:Transcript_12624/g.22303  ORF Transcript_12624/g.22303 Transcript_12624/m.22303 type:complete len:470 (-) Transcript_12624:103-1512(-)